MMSIRVFLTGVVLFGALGGPILWDLPSEADESLSCGDEEACYTAAMTYFRAGDVPIALERFRDVLSRFPEGTLQGPTLFMVGRILAEEGDPEAETTLRQTIASWEPIRDYVHFWLCVSVEKQGNFLEAARCYETLFQRYPDSPIRSEALFRAAKRFHELEDFSRAQTLFETFLSRFPGDRYLPEVLNTLGRIAMKKGDARLAGDYLKRLWVEYPSSPQSKQSLESLNEVWKRLPSYPRIVSEDRLKRATRLYEIGAYRGAIREYETVLSMKGVPKMQREEAEYFVARSYNAVRQWPMAIEGFNAYLKRYPSGKYRAETLFYLGKASLREGNDEAYLQAHNRYLKKYPDGHRRGEILYRLALFYRDKGDDDRAVALFDEVMENEALGEWVSQALWEKGWMAYRKGDYSEAVSRWQPLTRRPELGMASQALYWQGRSYEKRGLSDKADELFQSLCADYPYSYYCILAGFFREPVPAYDDLSLAEASFLSDPEVEVLRHPRYHRLEALIRVDLLPVQSALEVRLLEREYRHDKPSLLTLAEILTKIGDIPHVIGMLQNHFSREITRGGIGAVRFWEMVYPRPYEPVVRFYAGHYGVDPALVWALIREESWFNPEARSTAGALGLMQLMPDTAQILRPKTVPFPDDDGPSALQENPAGPSGAQDLFVPERNIALGVHFLSDLLTRFDGETVLAVAAYNAGPGAVARWTREIQTDEIDEFVESIPYPETRRYVERVIRSYAEYQRVGILTGERQKQYSHAQDP